MTVFCVLSVVSVGVDAHIDPACKSDFTEIPGESDGTQWGDVGIAPYAYWERYVRIRKGVRIFGRVQRITDGSHMPHSGALIHQLLIDGAHLGLAGIRNHVLKREPAHGAVFVRLFVKRLLLIGL